MNEILNWSVGGVLYLFFGYAALGSHARWLNPGILGPYSGLERVALILFWPIWLASVLLLMVLYLPILGLEWLHSNLVRFFCGAPMQKEPAEETGSVGE